MEVLIAVTAVLIGRAKTNTALVLCHGMNKNNVAKHAENEKFKMPSMMITLTITAKVFHIFKSLFYMQHSINSSPKELAPWKILPPKIKEVKKGKREH